MSDIVSGLGRTSAFGALGLVLLILGIVLVDVLTPGKLPSRYGRTATGTRPSC